MKMAVKLLLAAALIAPVWSAQSQAEGLDAFEAAHNKGSLVPDSGIVVPAAKSAPVRAATSVASVGKPASYIRRAKLLPDGRVANIRLSRKGKDDYNWGALRIDPAKVSRAFWGTNEGILGNIAGANGDAVGHAFVAFEFKKGGLSAGRYLVVSVEPVVNGGEDYVGMDTDHEIVWLLSSLESYLKLTVDKEGIDVHLEPFSGEAVDKQGLELMVREAIRQAVADRNGERFQVFTNNCVMNALKVVDAGLRPEQRLSPPHEFMSPRRSSLMLEALGLLDEGFDCTPSNPGCGLVRGPK